MKIAVALMLVLLSGCSVIERRETPVICKAADVATTVVALKTTAFHEANPVMNALMGGAHGFAPFLVVSALYAGAIYWLDNPKVSATTSVITCGVAAHNGIMMLKVLR